MVVEPSAGCFLAICVAVVEKEEDGNDALAPHCFFLRPRLLEGNCLLPPALPRPPALNTPVFEEGMPLMATPGRVGAD